jgi:hypothetical protein
LALLTKDRKEHGAWSIAQKQNINLKAVKPHKGKTSGSGIGNLVLAKPSTDARFLHWVASEYDLRDSVAQI